MKAKVKYPALKKENKKSTGKKAGASVSTVSGDPIADTEDTNSPAGLTAGLNSASKLQEVNDDCESQEERRQPDEKKGESPSSLS